MKILRRSFGIAFAGLVLLASALAFAQGTEADYERAARFLTDWRRVSHEKVFWNIFVAGARDCVSRLRTCRSTRACANSNIYGDGPQADRSACYSDARSGQGAGRGAEGVLDRPQQRRRTPGCCGKGCQGKSRNIWIEQPGGAEADKE